MLLRIFQEQAPELSAGLYLDPMLDKPIPALSLAPLHNTDRPLNLAELKGEPYLFNVFASWCSMCQLEHEELKKLKEKTGLPLYGMAWKDNPEDTKIWLNRFGNIYDAVGTDIHGKAAIELGLTGSPETYLVDKNGIIIAINRGVLAEVIANHRFLPALLEAQQEGAI
ncbi:MAG: redoxin family protein [Alphaproteobacteria bacterium]|nr:redoxin family protein [Alphaproteobacteria bacterium]